MTARKTSERTADVAGDDWDVAPSAPKRAQKPAPKPMSLPKAMAAARALMPDITDQPFDGIASAERDGEGWRVVAEVIESRARIGDNDLLSSYELDLDAEGELTGFRRLRRYHREDREA